MGNGVCPSIGPVFLGLWAAAVIHGVVLSLSCPFLPSSPSGVAECWAYAGTTPIVYAYRSPIVVPKGMPFETWGSMNLTTAPVPGLVAADLMAAKSCLHPIGQPDFVRTKFFD